MMCNLTYSSLSQWDIHVHTCYPPKAKFNNSILSTVVRCWHNVLLLLFVYSKSLYRSQCQAFLATFHYFFCVAECSYQIDANISEHEISFAQFSHWLCIIQPFFFSFYVNFRSIYHPRGHAHLSALVPSESKNWALLLLFNIADETKTNNVIMRTLCLIL